MNKALTNLSTFILDSCRDVTNHEIKNNELIISTKANNVCNLLEDLKKKEKLNFEMLLDITAVDYPKKEERKDRKEDAYKSDPPFFIDASGSVVEDNR